MLLRAVTVIVSLLLLWQAIVMGFSLPDYLLPTPYQVLQVLWQQAPLLIQQSAYTITEALLGLLFGSVLGCLTALLMSFIPIVRWWLLPIIIISQAIPTFAIAPLLVVWLGYGMLSKIAVTILMLFFPITSAFFDGLCRTPVAWLELAKTMNANSWQLLWHIRIPAALPALASGLRMATILAPIGAVIGEWVGASHGLGFLILSANARLQIDMMFAAIFIIVIFSLLLYFSVDALLKRFIYWS